MIILKVTKNQDFTLSLEDTLFFEKPLRDGGGGLTPLSCFRVTTGVPKKYTISFKNTCEIVYAS